METARRRPAMAAAAMACVAMLAAWSTQAAHATSPAADPAAPEFVPGELIVRFRAGVGAAERAAVRADGDARLRSSLPLPGAELLRLAPGDSVRAAAADFQRDPDVLYAEPNFNYELDAVPNDPRFGELWGLHNTGQLVNGVFGTADADIDAPEAWDITTGSASVAVAVVDSGIAYDHPDLAQNIWSNPGEIAGNGIDDDGNGRIDDVRGWDFIDSDNSPRDVSGHGTHVAGTIGARGNNGQGVVGVNWSVSLMPLRACGAAGTCSTSAIVAAFAYAVRKGARVVNGSFGAPVFSQTMADVIDLSPDTLFVVAAGNDGHNLDAPGFDAYPCEIPEDNVICVGATGQNDGRASFSNYGATTVDLAAPGVDILSTLAPPDTLFSEGFEGDVGATWTTGGTNSTWARTSERAASGAFSLTDSPGANYANDTDSFARPANAIDLSGRTDCNLAYEARLATQVNDGLVVDRSTDAATWTAVRVVSGSTGGVFVPLGDSLAGVSGQSSVYVRFRLISNATATDDGVHVDDVRVVCPALTYDAADYDFLDGTSMATPQVTGTVALMLSRTSAATVAQLRQRLFANVDVLPSLAGVTVTGGRVNAAKAAVPPPPPVATIQPATAITQTGATLNGTVNPRGYPTGYRFEYGTTTNYGASTPVQGAGGGQADVAVSAPLTGLEPNTTYHYRLVASYPDGSVSSGDAQFTTQGLPPVVGSLPATAITTIGANLHGTVNANGTSTTFHFEYGTTTEYGNSTPEADAGAGTGQVAVSAPVSFLVPDTTYHFRLVATSSGGTVAGEDVQFTTAPLGPPVVAHAAPTMVLRTSATLNGTVDPAGKSTLYRFQYGLTTSYGLSTAPGNAGEGSGPLAITADLTGLTAGTTYHFRMVATNADGTVIGEDAQFTTAAVGPPVVALAAPSPIAKRSATLNGTVDPRGVATTYRFDYGTTTAYGQSTPVANAAPGSGEVGVSAELTGLTPGTTYHYRLVAMSADGTTVGGDGQLTTAQPTPAVVGLTAPTSVTKRTATLNGTVDPRGVATTYHFDYGPTTAYGESTEAGVADGNGDVAVSADLTGLAPGTTYHFRLVATSADGTTVGGDGQLTTAPLTPALVALAAATPVAKRSATLNGTVDPRGLTTTYQFEYGTTTAYGESTEAGVAAGSGSVAVSGALTGLAPGTTYHFRLVATNADGTTVADDEQFTTAPLTPPGAAVGSTTAITQTRATVSGTVNPRAVATAYHFEYGTTTAYGSSTATVDAGAGTGATAVTAALSGLAPGTTYHVRLVATSEDGTALSDDAQFTTLPDAVTPAEPTPTPPSPAPPVVAPGPAPAQPVAPFRIIAPATLRLDRRGAVAIRLAFPAGTPAGTGRVELLRGRPPAAAARWSSLAPAYGELAAAPKRIGAASFTVRPGQTVSVRIPLTRAGRRLVGSRRSVAATLKVTVLGKAQTKRVQLKRRRG
jgi:subtilisin family serine protease